MYIHIYIHLHSSLSQKHTFFWGEGGRGLLFLYQYYWLNYVFSNTRFKLHHKALPPYILFLSFNDNFLFPPPPPIIENRLEHRKLNHWGRGRSFFDFIILWLSSCTTYDITVMWPVERAIQSRLIVFGLFDKFLSTFSSLKTSACVFW